MKMLLRTFLLVTLLLSGCIPERVVWSPDGSRAAVLGNDGLHLSDPDGKLSPLLIPDVKRVSWFPDSKRVAVIYSIELKNWRQLEKEFPAVARNAATIEPRVLKALLALQANLDNIPNEIASREELPFLDVCCALIDLREHDAGELKPKLGAKWPAFEAMGYSCLMARVFDLSDGKTAKGEAILRAGASIGEYADLGDVRVSPTGKAVAVTVGSDGDKSARLVVVDPGGSGASLDLGLANFYPDWSPDGESVVYMRCQSQVVQSQTSEEVQFGTLSRQVVMNEGKLIERTDLLRAREDLAGLLFAAQARVRAARDGRIYFCTVQMTLPAAAMDVPQRPSLFFVQPGKQAVVTRAIPHGIEGSSALGDMPVFFEVSPDGTHIAIPFEDGRVSVLDVATGTVEVVTDPQAEWPERNNKQVGLTSVPVWRSTTELTFVQPAADGSKLEVVRHSPAGTVPISGTWPEAVSRDWLLPRDPAQSAPATKMP